MLQGWREQYDRMQRWYARLTESAAVDDRRVDDFYAFFIWCFHLKDWLKQDSSVESEIGADAETLVNSNLWLRICADIANGSKHLKLDWTTRIDAAARVERATAAFDTAGFSPDAFLTRDLIIVPVAGTAWLALHVAKNAVTAWDNFLAERRLLADTGSDHPRGHTGTSRQ